MKCKNHPEVDALDRCTGCSETFCENCLVEMKGQKYCGDCKQMAVTDQPAIPEEATTPCKEAGDALLYGIIGIFCFGVILGPVAIVKGLKAKKLMEEDPSLSGSGKATAAIIIGIATLVILLLGMVARLSNL